MLEKIQYLGTEEKGRIQSEHAKYHLMVLRAHATLLIAVADLEGVTEPTTLTWEVTDFQNDGCGTRNWDCFKI